MRGLMDGRVPVEGIDLDFIPLTVEETFYRQLRHQDFDLCELSLSSYVLTLNEPEPPFIAIPVFPSRFFRHQSIYVNADSGIESPRDLIGKRVGTPEFQMTAGVWERGILADEYDVPIDSVRYFTGALTGSKRREEKVALDLPANLSVTPIADGKNLSDMLAAGEIDAIYTAPAPSTYGKAPQVRHLFEDFKDVEQAYFEKTRIFPIMHTVAIKRALYERHPWIARSLIKAFEQSLELAYQDLKERSALKIMLPWLQAHLTETLEVLGSGYWDYGIEANRHVLEAFTRYSYDQGLAKRLLTAEELFADGADDGFQL